MLGNLPSSLHPFWRPCAPWLLPPSALAGCPLVCSSDTLGESLRYLSLVHPGIFTLVFHFINLICALKSSFCLLTQSNDSVTLTAMARAQEISINQLKCQPQLIKGLTPLSQSMNSVSIWNGAKNNSPKVVLWVPSLNSPYLTVTTYSL